MKKEDILSVLGAVVHPETGRDIVASGVVENVNVSESGIVIYLLFARSRDPFAPALKREVLQRLGDAFPEYRERITVAIKEAAPKETPAPKTLGERQRELGATSGIGHVIAISSGKGGVGKSTVAANLAVTLSRMGYRVGLLDADIYGPSQPKMFGVEGYKPTVATTQKAGGAEMMVPAVALGVKIMSIGFFINPNDALVWRGPMATNALRQLIHTTEWGKLDYLLVDLPPGTGDVHLTILQELKVDGAVIVSTPQGIALADVVRGVQMFRSEKVDVPVLGVVENMAWFTPRELPENRYYLFGRGGAQAMAAELGLKFLGAVPIIQGVMEAGEKGRPAVVDNSDVRNYYRPIAEAITETIK